MSRWSPKIFLDESSAEPIYLQIAQAIARDIQRGRLKPGEAIAGYRALAQELGVNRNTVLAAFHELAAQGWVVSKPGEGSAVAEVLPSGISVAPARETDDLHSNDLAASPPAPEPHRTPKLMMQAASGTPDPRLLPTAALSRAYREAARQLQKGKGQSDDPQGHPRLRKALAGLLSDLRGVTADPSRLLVTRGGQASLSLLGRALAGTGPIAIESPGASSAWETLRQAGAQLLPVPVDDRGLQVELLAQVSKAQALSAVLISPQRHYPTLAQLSEPRRRALLQLSRARNFLIIESDPDPEFQFQGQPHPALAGADGEQVIYVGTLSRVFSPGVRLGLIRAPLPLLNELTKLRQTLDESDVLLELAMAELIEDGELQRHVNRTRKIYQGRRDALATSLSRHLGTAVSFTPPEGGLAFWLRAGEGLDVDAWSVAAREQGVVFRPGRDFMFDRSPLQGLRLGFSSHAEPELDDLAHRLALALRKTPGEKQQ